MSPDPMSINIPQISPFSAFDNSPITIIDPSGEKGIHYLTITHSDGSSVRLRLVIEDNYSVMQRVAGLSSDGHNILKYFWYDFEQEHRVIFQEDGGFAVESDPPRILDVAYINSSEMLGNLILDVLPEETMTSIPGGVAFYTEDGSGDPTWTVSESNVATVDITVLMAYFKAAGKSARSSTVRRQYSPGGGIGKKAKKFIEKLGDNEEGSVDIMSLYQALTNSYKATNKLYQRGKALMDHFGSNDIQEPAIVSDTMFDEVVKVPGAIPNAVHRVNTTYREQVIQNQDGSLDTVKIKVKR